MELILIEGVQNLGNAGDLVKVKSGFARNFLLPQQKALRATEENKREFEAKRAEIEKNNAAKKKEAEKESAKLEGKFFVLIRQAGEDGRLYGSVSSRDIAAEAGVERGQVAQFTPIKALGVYVIKINLHSEVSVNIHINVARSADEAEIAKKEFQNPSSKKKADAEVAEEGADEAHEGKHKKKKGHKIVDVELDEEEGAAA